MNEYVETKCRCQNRRDPPSGMDDSYSPKMSAFAHFNDSDEFDVLADFRLSLVGLRSSSRKLLSSRSLKSSDEHRDELHSNRYSSMLETVRRSLLECTPQVSEDMISRAIINAFADANIYKRIRAHNEIEGLYQDEGQEEVDAIYRAYSFSQMRSENNAEPDKKNMQSFLQTILNEAFLKIQREEISSIDSAVRTISAVLSVLKLKVNQSMDLLADTIIMQGLPKHTTRSDLVRELSRFGRVKSVAIASQNGNFGYCRFLDESSATKALESHIQFDGATPIMKRLNLSNTKQ
jgi:RNA recognition motif. (a.k.a. RRM, RBD, or RNP domain)